MNLHVLIPCSLIIALLWDVTSRSRDREVRVGDEEENLVILSGDLPVFPGGKNDIEILIGFLHMVLFPCKLFKIMIICF